MKLCMLINWIIYRNKLDKLSSTVLTLSLKKNLIKNNNFFKRNIFSYSVNNYCSLHIILNKIPF